MNPYIRQMAHSAAYGQQEHLHQLLELYADLSPNDPMRHQYAVQRGRAYEITFKNQFANAWSYGLETPR